MGEVDSRAAEFFRRQGVRTWALRFRPPERDLDDALRAELNDSERIRANSLAPGPRRIEWAEARRLEREVRKALRPEGVRGSGTGTSVSHTTGIVMVLGADWGPGAFPDRGVGVDVEPLGRAVEPRVLDRIASPEERAQTALPGALDYWVVKEASFKANPANEGTVVMEYRIASFDSGTGEGRVEGPGGSAAFLLFTLQERWRVALAVVQRKKLV